MEVKTEKIRYFLVTYVDALFHDGEYGNLNKEDYADSVKEMFNDFKIETVEIRNQLKRECEAVMALSEVERKKLLKKIMIEEDLKEVMGNSIEEMEFMISEATKQIGENDGRV